MLMKPLLGTKPWGQSGTQVVSAFMKLTSALREADSAEKRVSVPMVGVSIPQSRLKGECQAQVRLCVEVKEGREEGNIRPGA